MNTLNTDLIKVENGAAKREPLPDFLVGLLPESLADLSWTDPALGVSDAVWLPEDDQSPPLGEFERYGEETLTPDMERKVVISVRAVEPWTQAEIDAELVRRNEEMSILVDIERDRRVDAGILFQERLYQSRAGDREKIMAKAVLALNDPSYGTHWIAADNSIGYMDNETLKAVGMTAMERKEALTFAGRTLKDMEVIPQDYTDDKYWS